jgi:hypothetical protein
VALLKPVALQLMAVLIKPEALQHLVVLIKPVALAASSGTDKKPVALTASSGTDKTGGTGSTQRHHGKSPKYKDRVHYFSPEGSLHTRQL